MKKENLHNNTFYNVMFYIIALFFVSFIGWAYYAEIDQVIRAVAEVEPVGKVKKIQSRYSGSVVKSAIAVGDTVNSSDILIELDTQEAQSTFEAANKKIDRLRNESADIAKKRMELLQTDSVNISRKKIAMLKTESLNIANKKIELLKNEYNTYEPLVAAGIEPKIRLLQINQRLLEVEGQRDQINHQLLEAEKEKDQIKQRLLEVKEQIDRIGQQLLEAEEQRDQAALQLKFSKIKSPISGLITAVNISGAGEVVRAGDVLAEVVPVEEYFLIKAKVLPKDIGKVAVGMKARVSFTAYEFDRYGVIEAEITKIAQNTTTTQQGEIFYEAWVKTKSLKFSKSDIKPNILPGMLAQVDMLGEKRTILQYLASPLNRTASRALTEQ